MAVSADHAAVQTDVAGFGGGDAFQLRGGEIVLNDAVFLVHQLHHRQLYPVGALALQGAAAQQKIQRLAENGFAQRLFVLLRAQMGQKVCDDQLGVTLVRADVDGDSLSIFQRHHAMKLHGNSGPLVLSDAAVVVGLEVAQLAVLIQRVGLQVQPGRVDVGGGDLRALAERLFPDAGQIHALAPVAEVQLVPRLQLHAAGKGLEASLLRQPYQLLRALPLGLARVQKRLVVRAIGLHGISFFCVKFIVAVFLAGE
ncbi:hypothetical protein SDC9_118444 [bioreactor metagenome]|uniref:Uncharacterized protein n=1 Tax=bioreactor metagenome TaxID=1076179 RepID=A0A645C1G9_9ZZZZ